MSIFRPDKKGAEAIEKHGIEWVDQPHGTRVTIELQAKFVRGRGSVDEYLEQTAIANPHVAAALQRSGQRRSAIIRARPIKLPAEPKEIKPHPYGVELGRLIALLHDAPNSTVAQFLTTTFSRVTSQVARKICNTAKISTRSSTRRIGRKEADSLLSGDSGDEDCLAGDRLHFADRRRVDS